MNSMIYPRGSNPDHNPLHVLCCNDTCSFTWTGAEHINQDIFECRTCGLTGSLCCCTECARVCHKVCSSFVRLRWLFVLLMIVGGCSNLGIKVLSSLI